MREVNCSKVKDILRIRDFINRECQTYGYTIPIKLRLFKGYSKLTDYVSASDVCNYLHANTKDNAIIICSRTGSYNFPELSIYEL